MNQVFSRHYEDRLYKLINRDYCKRLIKVLIKRKRVSTYAYSKKEHEDFFSFVYDFKLHALFFRPVRIEIENNLKLLNPTQQFLYLSYIERVIKVLGSIADIGYQIRKDFFGKQDLEFPSDIYEDFSSELTGDIFNFNMQLQDYFLSIPIIPDFSNPHIDLPSNRICNGYNFLGTNSQLKGLYDSLNPTYVNCSWEEFEIIFSGKKIDNKILWLGSATELLYFIECLSSEYDFLDKTTKRSFVQLKSCFLNKAGKEFNTDSLKNLKTEDLADASSKKIIRIIEKEF
jgi:hypothetical protein